MRKIDDPSAIRQWGYHDLRLGRGFTGTREHIILQVQEAYLRNDIDFREHEIPALIDHFMCEQGLASSCSDRIEGLGDLIHLAVKPFAKALDAVAGTRYATSCPSCAKRREALNQAFPL